MHLLRANLTRFQNNLKKTNPFVNFRKRVDKTCFVAFKSKIIGGKLF